MLRRADRLGQGARWGGNQNGSQQRAFCNLAGVSGKRNSRHLPPDRARTVSPTPEYTLLLVDIVQISKARVFPFKEQVDGAGWPMTLLFQNKFGLVVDQPHLALPLVHGH